MHGLAGCSASTGHVISKILSKAIRLKLTPFSKFSYARIHNKNAAMIINSILILHIQRIYYLCYDIHASVTHHKDDSHNIIVKN